MSYDNSNVKADLLDYSNKLTWNVWLQIEFLSMFLQKSEHWAFYKCFMKFWISKNTSQEELISDGYEYSWEVIQSN